MKRRDLMRWVAATAGMAGLQGLTPRQLRALGRAAHAGAGEGFLALNPHQAATVTAAAEIILPRTDTPGATDAGVTMFVDSMLDGWHTPEERTLLLSGLSDLDARSRTKSARNFVDLSPADQTAVLAALDAEAQGTGSSVEWFRMLKYLTVYGYCTSEVGATKGLGIWPKPFRYDPCAPLASGGRG